MCHQSPQSSYASLDPRLNYTQHHVLLVNSIWWLTWCGHFYCNCTSGDIKNLNPVYNLLWLLRQVIARATQFKSLLSGIRYIQCMYGGYCKNFCHYCRSVKMMQMDLTVCTGDTPIIYFHISEQVHVYMLRERWCKLSRLHKLTVWVVQYLNICNKVF